MNLHNIFFGLLLTAALSVGVYIAGPETFMDEARSFVGMEEATPAFVRPPVTAEEIPQALPVNPTSVPAEQPVEQAAPVGGGAPPHANLSTEMQEVTCSHAWWSRRQHLETSWAGPVTYYENSDSVDLALSYDGQSPTCGRLKCYTINPLDGRTFNPVHTCILSPLAGGQGPVEIKVNRDVYRLNEKGDGFSVREAFGDEVCPGQKTAEEMNASVEAQLEAAAD